MIIMIGGRVAAPVVFASCRSVDTFPTPQLIGYPRPERRFSDTAREPDLRPPVRTSQCCRSWRCLLGISHGVPPVPFQE